MVADLTQHTVSDPQLAWNTSAFGLYCPVTLVEQRQLVRGSAEIIATYQGAIFVFASKENRLKFCQCPTRYLAVDVRAPCRVIIDAPSSASATINELAEALAKARGVPVIDGTSFAQTKSLDVGTEWVAKHFSQSPAELSAVNAAFLPRHVVAFNYTEDLALVSLNNQFQSAGARVVDVTKALAQESPVHSALSVIQNAIDSVLTPTCSEIVHEDDYVDDTQDPGFGDFRQFCPVALKDLGLLRPASGDFAVRYEGRVYRTWSAEARASFIADPRKYVTDQLPTPPPLRFLLIGPSAAGKSTHARKLARRLRCFHISFPERVREVALTDSGAFADELRLHIENPEENLLTPDVALSVVQSLWHEEPYKSRGFILEGYPRHGDDCRAMLDRNLYADFAVHLTISEEVASKRKLPKIFAAFEKKRNEQLQEIEAKQKAKDEAKEARHNAWLEEKQAQRDERQRKRDEALAQLADGEDAPEEEQEFEEEYIDPVDDFADEEVVVEEVDAARDRIQEELSSKYLSESSMAAEAADALTEQALKVIEINGNRREEYVKQSFERALTPFTTLRDNLFFLARKVSLREAESMLESGFKRLSSFGTWCPNQLLNNTAVQPTYKNRFPVVYRDYIYFFASEADRDQFFINSTALLSQPPPPACVPIRVAVVGLPKSGKSALADAICNKYGCLRVSISSALRSVLDEHADLELAANIRAHLCTGDRVPDQFCVDAVRLALTSAQAALYGYVLDGFPQNQEHVDLLNEMLIIPPTIIQLSLSGNLALQRNAGDSAKSSDATTEYLVRTYEMLIQNTYYNP